jgi:hypothetical protein
MEKQSPGEAIPVKNGPSSAAALIHFIAPFPGEIDCGLSVPGLVSAVQPALHRDKTKLALTVGIKAKISWGHHVDVFLVP